MELAINGGKPVRTKPFPGKGKRFGNEELTQLKQALKQGTLFGPAGKKVKEFEQKFAKYYGKKFCVTTTSGTAAIHVALGSLKIKPGDEIITSSVTDMGTIAPIWLVNAIPILCDIDEKTYCMDTTKLEALISPRTKAIIAVHLFGQTCDMDPIMAIAKKHNLSVIEDCAQSYLSTYKGRINGTIGDMGCFSINDHKHMSCGDGGMLITDDEELAKMAVLFRDKCYYRDGSSRNPEFMAPNYRLTELQGAVAIAQLGKLRKTVNNRRKICRSITKMLAGTPGIIPPYEAGYAEHSYFCYVVRVDEKELGVSIGDFCAALNKEGIPGDCTYLDVPIYMYNVFQKKKIHGETSCPYGCRNYDARDVDYVKGMCPVAEKTMGSKFILNLHEYYTAKDAKDVADGIKKVAAYYHDRKKA
jgi:perosamine synthetase